MERVNYLNMNYAKVVNKLDFFKSKNNPEMIQVKSLYESIKLLFNLPSDRVELETVEGNRIYKYNIISPTVQRLILGFIVYLPLEKRLDIYTVDNLNLPLIQFKDKKPVFKNYSSFLDRVGLDRLFNKLLSYI